MQNTRLHGKKVADGYIKYTFATKEHAVRARRVITRIYPTMKIKVSDVGSIFCHTNGDMSLGAKLSEITGSLYDLYMYSEV